MSDIFISYAAEDRSWVEGFAQALMSKGFSVWWDRHIPTGESYHDVIKRELKIAKCVIVVWSHHSVGSNWVKDEADTARNRKILMPVAIDNAERPLGFMHLQTQGLQNWEAGNKHPGFNQLIADIERMLGTKPPLELITTKRWRLAIHPIWLLITPSVLAVLIAIGLMLWPISTRIKLELLTERVEFEVQNHIRLAIPNAEALTIEKFSAISFEPGTIDVADPSQYKAETDQFPPSAWKRLNVTGRSIQVTAKAVTLHPRVTIMVIPARSGGPTSIHLDSIALNPGTHVTVETREANSTGVIIKLSGQNRFALEPSEDFRMITDEVKISGLADVPFSEANELTYKIQRASSIDVVGSPEGAVISPTFAAQDEILLFRELPISSLDFTREARRPDELANQRFSALVGSGVISFPDYPHLGRVELSPSDALGMERIDRFTIKKLSVAANSAGMVLEGLGWARQIRTKSGQVPIQYRLTAFDALKHNPEILTLLAIIGWVFPTTVGAYRIYKGFKPL
jgi:hypothetical protein